MPSATMSEIMNLFLALSDFCSAVYRRRGCQAIAFPILGQVISALFTVLELIIAMAPIGH
jgi:hypothetical protein